MTPVQLCIVNPGEAAGSGDVGELFDRESDGYDDAHEGPLGHFLRARMAAVLELIGPGPGDVLDAGMGPGRLCAELDSGGWTVSGIDISEQMIARAARRLPHAGERLVQGSITHLPFADESFDAVAATGALEYLDDPGAGLEELARVLRAGGLAVVTVPNPVSLTVRWDRYLWYPAVRGAKRGLPVFSRPAPHRKPPAISARALKRMVTGVGLDPVAVRHANVAVLPTPSTAQPRISPGGWQSHWSPRLRASCGHWGPRSSWRRDSPAPGRAYTPDEAMQTIHAFALRAGAGVSCPRKKKGWGMGFADVVSALPQAPSPESSWSAAATARPSSATHGSARRDSWERETDGRAFAILENLLEGRARTSLSSPRRNSHVDLYLQELEGRLARLLREALRVDLQNGQRARRAGAR